MKRILTTLLVLALIPALAAANSHILFDDLGSIGLNKADLQGAATGALADIMADRLGAAGDEEMIVTRVINDDRGTHIRFQQAFNGLMVVGAEMVLHLDHQGNVTGVNGDFVRTANLPLSPAIGSADAFAMTKGMAGAAQLAYLGEKLAWAADVSYINEQGPQVDRVFTDAMTGKELARHPQVYYALSASTYTCNNTACGTLVQTCASAGCSNTGDAAVDAAHNYAIATYDYFAVNHGRDSIDDNGMTLVSRVHYGSNYNNAFWNGSQMTYGDGDGTTFIPLSQDADVVAHELTHGVTERSSGLIYQNESGALNEAWSDIFGALVDRQEGATGADIWLLGEDIYTPAIPGDGLRDMAFPSSVGDYDCYPIRYTGTSDNGGVHWNSGIANLAFVLLVEGGSHPASSGPCAGLAGPSTGIGFAAAADIFYAANNSCLTASSNFAAARACTVGAAGANAAAVEAAWDAVGVGAPAPPPPPIALTDGVAETGQSASTGNEQQYTLDVASGASNLTFTISANNGDADLYVNYGSEATSANADCSGTSSNSNESCSISNPSAGTWYAMVHAWSSFSNLTIEGTTGGGGGPSCAPLGASCSSASDCCSNKCKGKAGSQTCK